MSNPFSKIFGREPDSYIERIDEKEKIITDFSSEKPSEFAYLICGPRGSGKTVLMTSIASYFENQDDWVVLDPGPKENLLENVAAALYENARLKTHFLKGEFSFSFQGLTFSLKGDTPVTTPFVFIDKMAKILKKKHKKILITIDEVDNSKEMKSFIEAYQSLIRGKNDIFLLMTGLYENVSKLLDNPSLTFLYRTPKIVLGPLSLPLVAAEYEKLLCVPEKESYELAKMTKGYAYAYQVLGSILFEKNKKTIDPITLRMFDTLLAEHVYGKIYATLSNNEKTIVKSFHSNEEVKVAELIKETNLNSSSFSLYRDRLIKKGVLTSKTYGYLCFTLPRFNEFLQNQY